MKTTTSTLKSLFLASAIALSLSACQTTDSAQPEPFAYQQASVADLQRAMQDGELSAEQLVHYYLDRIARHNTKGF